jgi:hypothetical protein
VGRQLEMGLASPITPGAGATGEQAAVPVMMAGALSVPRHVWQNAEDIANEAEECKPLIGLGLFSLIV